MHARIQGSGRCAALRVTAGSDAIVFVLNHQRNLGLVRLGVISSDRLRRNRRIGYVLMLTFAILLPTIDPVSLVLEVVPLFVLFEASIWLSVFMERRWERSAAEAEAL